MDRNSLKTVTQALSVGALACALTAVFPVGLGAPLYRYPTVIGPLIPGTFWFRQAEANPAGGGGGSIAFDAASNGTPTTGTSISWSHTTGSLTNGSMIVTIMHDVAGGSFSCTYNSVSMTAISQYDMNSGVGRVAAFKLANPASGAHTVACTGPSTGALAGSATTWSGVDQTSIHRTVATADNNSTNPTVTVSNAQSGDVVVDIVGTWGASGSVTVHATQTNRYTANLIVATNYSIGNSSEAATGSTVMSWTAGSSFWGMIAFALIPA